MNVPIAAGTSTPAKVKPWRVPGRIAYIVSHSYPYSSNGYAVRTHGVATGLRDLGHSIIVINRPGRPWDVNGFNTTDFPLHQDIDGVRYLYLREPSRRTHTPDAWQAAAPEALQDILSAFKPSLVMAASNWETAQPALRAARALDLPFFYEVRGFWEITRASLDPEWAKSTEYCHALNCETSIAQQADCVFTLNSLMRNELVRRGVQAERIKLVPNGVGGLPDLKKKPALTREALGIKTRYVVGYIGSFNFYEGLEDLIRASGQLVRSGVDLSVILVGSSSTSGLIGGACSVAEGYRELAQAQGLGQRLILPGRVSADQASDYYRLIDLVVIPRVSLPVTELVSPIKPLTAAAHGKALLMSDVAPLAELAATLGAETFQKGDISHLAARIKGLLDDQQGRLMLGKRALVRLKEQGRFHTNVEPITHDYRRLALYYVNRLGFIKHGGELAAERLMAMSLTYTQNKRITDVLKGGMGIVSFEPILAPITALPLKRYACQLSLSTKETTRPEKHKPALTSNLITPGVNSESHHRISADGKHFRQVDKPKTYHYLESFRQILEEAKAIPDSNGSEYFAKHDFRVGVIGDAYMYNFYKDVFAVVRYLSPSNHSKVLTQDFDIVIYTTCWKGLNNEEWRGIKYREKPKKALDAILTYAAGNKIKTVFQSIEDPSNFDYFLPLARKFDYVLTADTDCIKLYKEKLGHDNVFFGEYGFNPQFNNPIGCRRKTRNAAFFAGSFPKRYRERCEDMETVFDSIVGSGGKLLIADRNFGSHSDDLVYPPRFQPSTLPSVEHAVLQKVHKLFRYNLNFNSIKQSPTMCAMRSYELQAQGNGLISNYAKSVFNKFPGMRIVPYKQDMNFDFVTDESWEEYRANIRNVREVLNNKTSYQVVSTLLGNIGLSSITKERSTIAVVCAKKTSTVMHSFAAQVYPNKLLIEEAELNSWQAIKVKHKIGYFCWFGDSNQYERYYLCDLLNGFKFVNCRYITKNAHFDKNGQYISGKEHEYTSSCSGKSLSLFSAKYLEPTDLAQYELEQSFALDNGYSIDPFEVNFFANRRGHASSFGSYKLSVVVPVFNNGRFLVGKCIPSLQRNRLWSDMEILLIDDGSTDQETLAALTDLDAMYPNVQVMYNHDGGSGSASRPRNQGINLASAPLVSFLDPDNEIAPAAYDLLVDLYDDCNKSSAKPVEFVSGFHVKVSEQVKIIGKHTAKRLCIIDNLKQAFFERGRFPVIATQSAVISKAFLDGCGLRFIEKSLGQDTLFGWELIAKASRGAFSGEPYLIYYADRGDSVTNMINLSYFERKLVLEKRQRVFLEENGVLSKYLESKFDAFMEGWYLKKLSSVSEQEEPYAVSILDEICKLYGKNITQYL